MKRLLIDLALIALTISLMWDYSTAWGQRIDSRNALAFVPFAGTWTFHDGGLSIDRSGHGTESFRTFVNCTATIQTACDKFQGNIIYNGGFTQFTLKKVVRNRATGAITNSAYSWAMFTAIAIIFNPAKDSLTIRTVTGGPIIACGKKAVPGTCGA